ncbi:MAG: outer membrane homotrimeric porin [Desulfovibrionaceae bacterium]
MDKRAKFKEGIHMKKLATLLLAAGLVFSAATGASAIDFKAKGQWLMSFDYGQDMISKNRNGRNVGGSGYSNKSDSFDAQQRVRLQLDAVASESLSGTVYFEIGNQRWGQATNGGALGADGTVVEVKRAYLDWIVPQTDLKIRMGLQGVALPAFSNGASQVFDNDVAGITASYKFNDTVAATLLWARPYNDNFEGDETLGHRASKNFLDNLDMFALLVPLTFDGVKVTPWVSYAAVGKNVSVNLDDSENVGSNNKYTSYYVAGMTPAAYAQKNGKRGDAYGSAFWAGITGEVTVADPFRFAWDANYGSYTNGIEAQKREGYYLSILGEYKMDWATPGLYAWYSSGDDSNVKNGSERMPSLSADSASDGFSTYATIGDPYIARDGVLSNNWIGTWGIGARLKDISYLEDLKHTFRINYIAGTNSPTMAKYIMGKKGYTDRAIHGANMGTHDFRGAYGTYLTTQDSGLEFGLTTTYKIYDNLNMFADMNYIAMFMDQSRSVWGTNKDGKHIQLQDPWNINVSFVYDF